MDFYLYLVKVSMKKNKAQAQLLLPTNNLTEEMSFFQKIGFRLDQIFPADDPQVAILSGHGLELRIDRNAQVPASHIRLLTDEPDQFSITQNILIAPNGTQIELHPKTYQLARPKTQHKFETKRLTGGEPWVVGRAGMMYRDLISDRLGDSIIASHIHIPNGGPVPDMVHYHTIGFQLIYCYRGWVKLVYEDQGPPFILKAGDCVTQPPEIRHQVLEASDNLQVIEIGVPAEHMTTIDHDLELPTKTINRTRVFNGQTFCHHQLKNATWEAWRITGFEARSTGINGATNGLADVKIVRPKTTNIATNWTSHTTDILFTFILEGSLELEVVKEGKHALKAGDAFVMPPDRKSRIIDCSDGLEFLEISLPGIFKTIA